jgi:6 kDa early secretory antigenic target
MSRFEVDSAQVAQAAGAARASSAVIHTEVAAMLSHLAALEGSWRGAAATTFAALVDEWRRTQTMVESSLERITQALDVAARQYADAETAAMRLFTP